MQVPTLCNDIDELLLDLKIYGKMISTPQQSFDEMRQALFEEFKLSEPFPTLERDRYELSRLVSDEYKIRYDSEVFLQDNETLVDISEEHKLNIKDVTFDNLEPLVRDVKNLFKYEEGITDSLRASILAEFDLETGAPIEDINVAQTEKIFGTVKQDESLVVSDEEYQEMLDTSQDEEEPIENNNVSQQEDSYNSEYEDDYSEDEYDDDVDDESNFVDDSPDDYDDDYDEDGYDDDEPDEYEDEYDEDQDGYDDEDPDDYEDEPDDYGDDEPYGDEEVYDDGDYDEDYEEPDSPVESVNTTVEAVHVQSSNIVDDIESAFIDAVHNGSNESAKDSFESVLKEPAPVVKPTANFAPDLDDIDIGKVSYEEVQPIHQEPPKQVVVEQSQEPRPTDLRAFLRAHPNSKIEVVLQYFSKKEIEDAVKRGRIIKRNGTLRAM